MCGITLYLSKENTQNAIAHVLASLYELQNRGYDSFGIAYYHAENKMFQRHKKAINQTSEEDTYKVFQKETESWSSHICMGHSRWATHGKVNETNAHPHVSNGALFFLIHNGIIENFKELKTFLLEKGYTFYSETDSEVIVNLLEYVHLYETKTTVQEAITRTISQLEGTFGLVILCAEYPDVAYVTKRGSPLLISETEHELMATSELSGFQQHTDQYYELNNNELVILSQQYGMVFESNEDNDNSRKMKPINPDFQLHYSTQQLGNYTHYTQKEIMEQDKTLWRSLNQGARILDGQICLGGLYDLKKNIPKIQNIIFMGCGSSYYAGCIGYHYIRAREELRDLNVFCFDGGDFELKDIPNGICLFVFISQSGETMDLMKHLDHIQASHYTMGIINVIDSAIAKEVDCGIYMNVSKEVAVASTKSFNSSVLLLKLFSLWLYQEKTNHKERSTGLITGFELLKMSNVLRDETHQIKQLIYQVKKVNHEISMIFEQRNIDKLVFEHIFILGKGTMECVARECALKLKEICYIHGEGLSAAALKHGPLAMVHEYFPIILLINHENMDKMLNAYHELSSRNAYLFILTTEVDLLTKVNHESSQCDVVLIPKNKVCGEILIMLTLQHLCYHLALRKKIDPDKPKNLAKVVTVE